MVFWILAAILTLITLAALLYGGGISRSSVVEGADGRQQMAHFSAQLVEIERDVGNNLMSATEAEAAKAELAREVMRVEAEVGGVKAPSFTAPASIFVLAGLVVAALAFGIYLGEGKPNLPSTPLSARALPNTPPVDVAEAIAAVEKRLGENPDDVRGWSVLGPIYMQSGRADDAVIAFRKVLQLLPPSADAETDLAEALMLANNGSALGEPLELLASAAARDPQHIRSRFYLAGEATRAGEFEQAIGRWQDLLGLSVGGEPWIAIAESGLRAAEAGRDGVAPSGGANALSGNSEQASAIRSMVEGLSERLAADGGAIEEWTRLVRSRMVLGEPELAQQAYDSAKLAYPDAGERSELDKLATEAGLK